MNDYNEIARPHSKGRLPLSTFGTINLMSKRAGSDSISQASLISEARQASIDLQYSIPRRRKESKRDFAAVNLLLDKCQKSSIQILESSKPISAN
jgi:hypothetical protein